MKAEAIKALKNVVTSTIKSSPKNEAVAKEAVKGGEKLMAAGQDAAAVQGRAMVKPYVKPNMEANMEKKNLKAASGPDFGGNDDPIPDRGDAGSFWDNPTSSSIWD